jgi:hypothetical protein
MDNRDYPHVRRAAVRQGWLVHPTKHGERFLSPDGRTTAGWHTTHASSDPHALDALIRQLRKGGFRWPP